mgnify:CR=1 FL=1
MKENVRIIVTADDFGLNRERNIAVEYAVKENICTNVSLVVNTEYSREAVQIAKKNNFVDIVGLHINLTEGRPLTSKILKYTNLVRDNKFISDNPRSLRKIFSFVGIGAIREEIEAQIIYYLDSGFTLKHIDFHNDVGFNLPVLIAIIPLLKKYKIKSLRGVEPYLFGFYRKSILSYLPIKYYYILCYKYLRCENTLILDGGRNINHFMQDIEGKNTRMKLGQISKGDIIEIIIHPNFKDGVYLDNTNFDKQRNIYSLENTSDKINSVKNLERLLLCEARETLMRKANRRKDKQ